ncbi:alpha/beta hydrolase [Mesotoga sp.]|uniref:alpha/beta fold hydrolase n=1 Tax=Mesotoga sp. TaxID=2053577 RepID=UPI001BD565BB|nr:alpha/beta hydrolase [Mesotoga sp.]
MDNLRMHGDPPYRVVVVHGGPGAAGGVAPLARELGKRWGVLEPYQTKKTVSGQIEELREIVENYCSSPVILLGHSWGAWLVFLFAAEHGDLVDRIILISSGPFEQHYASSIMNTRLNRLDAKEKAQAEELMSLLNNAELKDRVLVSEFRELLAKTDHFDLLEDAERVEVNIDAETYKSVWTEASEMRLSGELLENGKKIFCPVLAVHGDYDPHPAEGVEIPLSRVLENFRFRLLERCGHMPWLERHAREEFYRIVEEELEKG